MRALWAGAAISLLVAAAGSAPTSAAARPHSPPVVVLPALPGKTPSPATGRAAVALARANSAPSALARPYKAELGWTAQWQGKEWWLVGVYESDWGTRFVVRATVEGRYAQFGVGPTRAWILDNAQPKVTTLYTRFDPPSAVAAMKAELLSLPPPDPNPGSYPNFDPRNYTILDGAATLVQDEPEQGSYAGVETGLVVRLLRARSQDRPERRPAGDRARVRPPVPEGSITERNGASVYGFWDVWVRNDVRPARPALDDWVDSVIAARGWQPADWPSTGGDETFWSIPPFIPRPPFRVPRKQGGTTPRPATARAAVAVVHANLDVAAVLAKPFADEGGWTAQWRGNAWWLAGVFKSAWGKRFVVRATVVGSHVQFGAGPGRTWILAHVRPRLKQTIYTRLNPWSAALLLKAEALASPAQFDQHRYSILAEAAELVRDSPPTLDSGPAWYAVFYAKDLATGKNVVLPVLSATSGPLVETNYDASEPGATAYGFEGFDVLGKVPAKVPGLSAWIRRVVAKRSWHPTNFR